MPGRVRLALPLVGLAVVTVVVGLTGSQGAEATGFLDQLCRRGGRGRVKDVDPVAAALANDAGQPGRGVNEQHFPGSGRVWVAACGHHGGRRRSHAWHGSARARSRSGDLEQGRVGGFLDGVGGAARWCDQDVPVSGARRLTRAAYWWVGAWAA